MPRRIRSLLTPKPVAKTAASRAGERATQAPWTWTGVGVVIGALCATVAYAPAHWLAYAVAQASEGRVQLLQTQGSIWAGSAQLVLSAGPSSQEATALPGRVGWDWSVRGNGLALTLTAACCLPKAWVWAAKPDTQGIALRLADIPSAQAAQWPTAVLSGLGTPWNTLQLDGTLALSSQQLGLRWSRNSGWHVQGQAQLDANRISTSLSTIHPVGSYRVVLQGGDAPTLNLSTLEGSLLLNGQGQWQAGRFHFEGEGTAAPEKAEALGNLLNIIGRRDGARSVIKVG